MTSHSFSGSVLRQTPRDVKLLEGVESGEDTCASNTAKDIGARALHHRHEALVLHDLHGAIDGALVLNGRAGGHHHTTTNGIDGVGHQAGSDGDAVAQAEGEEQPGIGSQKNGLQRIVETEVHSTVYENTDAGNDESSVETLYTIGLDGLGVDVDQTLVLTLSSLALSVVGQTRTGVVERIDEQKGQRSRATTGQDVGGELFGVTGVLRNVESRLHLVLEGEVEGLRREVTQAVCQISTPQGIDTLVLHGSHGAVNDAFIGLIQAALTDHLILILDEQLDTLDRSGGRLRCNGGYAGQGEVLRESQLEVTHFGQFLYNL